MLLEMECKTAKSRTVKRFAATVRDIRDIRFGADNGSRTNYIQRKNGIIETVFWLCGTNRGT